CARDQSATVATPFDYW
nr:immunoglobulin heavy chain junction region [Macaca mulatta]MOV41408.1 immunoglobulin heavy chain junction region [Macaca mulatta]MOV43491.1 immunoglobulin heavy chain junction region [Macaca mulatta]MOV43860.1 immunoglobulin heavy chain junction region [Macaca mulatta]